MSACQCSQHGSWCDVHPNCVCGCPRHAHGDKYDGCIAGAVGCGCTEYRTPTVDLTVAEYGTIAAVINGVERRRPDSPTVEILRSLLQRSRTVP